jgi:hypothetical protein
MIGRDEEGFIGDCGELVEESGNDGSGGIGFKKEKGNGAKKWGGEIGESIEKLCGDGQVLNTKIGGSSLEEGKTSELRGRRTKGIKGGPGMN